jgi:hypothetical protein
VLQVLRKMITMQMPKSGRAHESDRADFCTYDGRASSVFLSLGPDPTHDFERQTESENSTGSRQRAPLATAISVFPQCRWYRARFSAQKIFLQS